MSMNTKKNVAIVLLVVSMLLWVLRKLNVLYIPGLSMILLAGSMIIVGIMMFQLKQKKKLGGTLILAFGLVLRGGCHYGDQGLFRLRNKKRTASRRFFFCCQSTISTDTLAPVRWA